MRHACILAFALFAFFALAACSEDTGGGASNAVECVPEAPVCDPPCAGGEVCGESCACEPGPACDPNAPVCRPACAQGEVCGGSCTCEAPQPEPTCDPQNPVCEPGCGEGEFCTESCACAPVPCDPQNPVCRPGCGDGDYCTSQCVCAETPCDPQNPVCAPGCGDGEFCTESCACEGFECNPESPVCPGGCGDGEFCNSGCACEPLCDSANPVCEPGCGEGEFCGRDCRCLVGEVCDPEAPVCVPGCVQGKVCNAACDCVEPCNPNSPLCTPACSPTERCNDACACEPVPCDPNSPVCSPTCGEGEFCNAQCLCSPNLDCDYQDPVCDPACGDEEFCGRDCTCHPEGLELPDLTVDVAMLQDSIYIEERAFSPNNCAIVEGCVVAPGFRRLMRFSTMTPNIGNIDMFMGNPDDSPDLFEYSECHAHYHFNGYAEYALYDEANQMVARGHKQAFCLLDTSQYVNDPSVATERRYNCSFQGIQRGWADVYGSGLDCQWIDITDVSPGRYRLEVSLNNFRTIEELSYDNNVRSVNVIVPPVDPLGTCDLQPRARGAARDCGWEIAGNYECEPGTPSAAGCTASGECQLGACEGDTVMRVCEGTDNGCTAGQALGNNDDACGSTCSIVNFVCPDSGRFTVLSGGTNPFEGYSCDLQTQDGFVFSDPASECTSGEQGLNRDCGWTVLDARTCTPGTEIQAGCNADEGCGLGACEGDTMMRVCAGHNTACRAEDRIATNDDACGSLCSFVTFDCPEEGVYTLMSAPFRSTRSATCTPDATGSALCPVDAMEPNDDPEEAPTLAAGTVSDLTICRGEREFYRIFATEADTIDVLMQFNGERAIAGLKLFNQEGELVAQISGERPVVRLRHPVVEAGAHRLEVQLISGNLAYYSLELGLQ